MVESTIRMIFLVVVISSLMHMTISPPCLAEDEKRPITPEDIYSLKNPSSPIISPDGEWVAYEVRQMYEGGWYYYIGVASSDGGLQWQSPGPLDLSYAWSPDGELAYWSIMDRSLSILYLKNMSIERIGISGSKPAWSLSPMWSPDGRFIAYVADGDLQLLDLDMHTTEQITSTGNIDLFEWSPSGEMVAFSGGGDIYRWLQKTNTTERLTESEENDSLAGWSPDGKYIAFHRGDFSSELDIYVVTGDGEERRLTDQPGMEIMNGWSPEGDWVVYNYLDINVLKWMEVWIVDVDGNMQKKDFDRSSWWPLWSSNGKIYFRAENEGTEDIYETSLNGSVKRITSGEKDGIVAQTMDVRGDIVAYTSGDVNSPTEVYTYDVENGTKRRITNLNDDFVEEVYLAEPVEFWFNATDGTPIQGWYLRPEGREECPLIMEAHGGPHLVWWNVLQLYYGFDFQILAAHGYGVAWINPRGSIGYDRGFAEAIRGDWGVNDSQDFLDGIDYLIEEGWVDENRLGFTGCSYGGYMTNWMITHTDRFKAAVSEAGISNLTRWYTAILNNFGDIGLDWAFCGSPEENRDVYKRCSPLTYVNNVTTPTLFIHGVRDLNAPVEESEEMVTGIIENTDTSVALIRYPGEGHGIALKGKNYLDRTYRLMYWFDSYLMVK